MAVLKADRESVDTSLKAVRRRPGTIRIADPYMTKVRVPDAVDR
jgi:hypothetical protein